MPEVSCTRLYDMDSGRAAGKSKDCEPDRSTTYRRRLRAERIRDEAIRIGSNLQRMIQEEKKRKIVSSILICMFRPHKIIGNVNSFKSIQNV